MIVPAIIQQLEATAGVTNLLAYHAQGGGKHAIYAQVIPQTSAHPLIYISQEDDSPEYALRGDSGLSVGIVDIEIQTLEKQGYGKLDALREQVRLALHPHGGTWGSVTVQDCKLSMLRDDDFVQPDKSETRVIAGGWTATVTYEQPSILV